MGLRRGGMAHRAKWWGFDEVGWGASYAKGEFVLLAPVKNQ